MLGIATSTQGAAPTSGAVIARYASLLAAQVMLTAPRHGLLFWIVSACLVSMHMRVDALVMLVMSCLGRYRGRLPLAKALRDSTSQLVILKDDDKHGCN